MNRHYAHRDGRNDADNDERYGRKQEGKTFTMQNENQIPDTHPLPRKRGRPPKARIEIEENEDLEVDEGKEETGGFPDPSRLPIRE